MTQPKFPLTDSEKVGRYISVKKRGQLCSKCTLQQDIQQSFMYLRSYSFLQFSNLFKLQQKQYINICRVNSTRQKKNALSLEKWRTTLPKTCWLSDSQLLIRRGLFACLQAIWPQTVTHQTVENRGMRAKFTSLQDHFWSQCHTVWDTKWVRLLYLLQMSDYLEWTLQESILTTSCFSLWAIASWSMSSESFLFCSEKEQKLSHHINIIQQYHLPCLPGHKYRYYSQWPLSYTVYYFLWTGNIMKKPMWWLLNFEWFNSWK